MATHRRVKNRYSIQGVLKESKGSNERGVLGVEGLKKGGGVKKGGFALLFYKVSALKIKGYIAILSGDL